MPIHCPQRVMDLLHALQMENEKLMLYHEDGSMSVLHPDSVYYFESVDTRYLHMENRRCRN